MMMWMNVEVTASRLTRDTDDPQRAAHGLVVLHYPQRELRGMRIPIGLALAIGRAPPDATGLALTQDARTSRLHATITRRGEQYVVTDAQSKNGSFVNGVRVTGETVLAVGDVLRLGDTLLELDVFDPSGVEKAPPPGLIGEARVFREMLARLSLLAQTDFSVMLEGETGSGKELLARYVHDGRARSGEYLAINCAAIPEQLFESYMFGHMKGSFTGATADSAGAFERAKNGTLFLDEIGEMPMAQQAKLLRVLETGDFAPVGSNKTYHHSAQVVAATNAKIAPSESTRFRQDLYARFASGIVRIPSLRERKLDVMPLFEFFLKQSGGELGDSRISPDIIERMVLSPWPLNLRELRALAQKVVLEARPLSEETVNARLAKALDITIAALGPKPAAVPTHTVLEMPSQPVLAPEEKKKRKSPPKEPMERERFEEVLRQEKGNIVRIALVLGHDRKQIYRWLKRFDLKLEDFR